MRRIVIATHNRKKAGEMTQILSARFPEIEWRTFADYPNVPEPEETGTTYAENAAIKAEHGVQWTQEWCLADDAGLEIDAMEGQPGLHSKRFAGEETPFTEKMRLILDRMEGVDEPNRAARFRCHVALARPNAQTEGFEATCEGRIATSPSGSGGFGYDPIFWLAELNCTMADLTAEQKHQISHRGKVLKQVGDRLSALIRESE